MKKKYLCSFLFALLGSVSIHAQNVDYSVVSVPEETGLEFMKITKESDYVCMPEVVRRGGNIRWITNRIISLSKNGNTIAFLSYRNDKTNIFIKDLGQQGSCRQRTNRSNVIDFSCSPDGKKIAFSETRGKENQIFQTDAGNGYVCRQITSGNLDYSPIYSVSMKQVLFARTEARGSSIGAYDVANNFVSSYAAGYNPCLLNDEKSFLCSRVNSEGSSEIWKVNFVTGQEDNLRTAANHVTDRGTYQYNPSTKLLKVTVTYTDDDEWDSTPPFTFEEKVEMKGNKLRFLPDEDDDKDDYWEMKRTSKTSM